MKRQNSIYYIDSKKLYHELSEHKEACLKAKKNGEQSPILNTYIGECILLLSKKIAVKSCFSGYSFIDEMISDGVENVIQYGIVNFDPSKKANAFSYFTQIIKWAFIRRIQKEKKQQYIKLKNMQNHELAEQLVDNSIAPSGNKDFDEFIRKFEDDVTKKKQKRLQTTGIEDFIEKRVVAKRK